MRQGPFGFPPNIQRETPLSKQQTRKIIKKPSVVVAYLHPGSVSAYFTQSLAAMLLYDQATDRNIVGMVQEWSSANISPARNNLAASFVDEYDAEWLLFIDSDMSWDHDALEGLLSVADPKDAPIVGGLCFGAHLDQLFPTIYQLAKRDGVLTTVRVNDFPDDAVVQCAATGAAYLLIHRSVLVAMREKEFNKTFPWFQETELAGKPCGEDITFCLRAGQLGFPVHVFTGVKVGHHKSRLLTYDLFRGQE